MKEKVFPLFGDWVLKVQWGWDPSENQVGFASRYYSPMDARPEVIIAFVVFGTGFQVSNVA